jgi:hypothetical protein
MSSGAYSQLRDEEQRANYQSATLANISAIFNTSSPSNLAGTHGSGSDQDAYLNLIINGSISTDSYMFENMTLRDLMSNEVVIMSKDFKEGTSDLDSFAQKIKLIFERIEDSMITVHKSMNVLTKIDLATLSSCS